MRARRSETPPAASPRRIWSGAAGGGAVKFGPPPTREDNDERTPHAVVVTRAEARAARIATRIGLTAAAVARQPARLEECPGHGVPGFITTRTLASRAKVLPSCYTS